MNLVYSRNKISSVLDQDGGVSPRCLVMDKFFEAEMKMQITIPQLEIKSVSAEIRRSPYKGCASASVLAVSLIGLQIGSGINRIVKERISGKAGCWRLADLAFECFDAVILRFTAEAMSGSVIPSDFELEVRKQKQYLEQNPRMIDSCIVFGEKSPFRPI